MRALLFFLVSCISLAVAAPAEDSNHKVTYWIAESDSAGFTIQNVAVDLPINLGAGGQSAGIGNIALNEVELAPDGRLRRPARGTFSLNVTYDDSTADANVRRALGDYGSLQRTVAFLVTDYCYQNRERLGLAATLKLNRTVVDSAGVNITTTENTWE